MATGCSKVLWSETNTSSNFQVEWKLCLKNLFPTIPLNGLPCHSPKYALPVHGCFNTLILFLVIQYNKVWEACIQIHVYTNNLRIIKPHFYWLLKDGIDSIFSRGFSYNSVDICHTHLNLLGLQQLLLHSEFSEFLIFPLRGLKLCHSASEILY